MITSFYAGHTPLSFTKGLPQHFSGTICERSDAWFTCVDSGEIVIQELVRDSSWLRLKSFRFDAGKVLTGSAFQHGLFATAALKNNLRETIAGLGKIKLTENNFAAVFGSAMHSRINISAGKYLETLDCFWSEELLRRIIPADHPAWKQLQTRFAGVPVLLTQPCRNSISVLKEIIDHLIFFPMDPELYEMKMDDLMEQYLFAIIDNTDYEYPGIKMYEQQKVLAARDMIATDLTRHYQTCEIAEAVGLNECTLKLRFRQLMNTTMFDYLLYLRCVKIRDLILTTDRPIKSFVREAGYINLANFLHGFKKHIGCYPAELRKYNKL